MSAVPVRVTVSPVGPVAAVCHMAGGGAPVLVLDDGAVSVRVELGALAAADVAALRHGLCAAVDDVAAAVGLPALPPPPYALDPAWRSGE